MMQDLRQTWGIWGSVAGGQSGQDIASNAAAGMLVLTNKEAQVTISPAKKPASPDVAVLFCESKNAPGR
jgi:hypothetical protein